MFTTKNVSLRLDQRTTANSFGKEEVWILGKNKSLQVSRHFVHKISKAADFSSEEAICRQILVHNDVPLISKF